MTTFRQYRQIEKDEFIVCGVDTAAGLGDYCVAQFISQTRLDVPLVYHSKVLATEMTNLIYPVLNRIFEVTGKKPVVAYERQSGGLFEMDRLASLNRDGKFELYKMPSAGRVDAPEAYKLGWDTNTATRPKMLSDLKEAVDKSLIKIYDKPTINEMFSFVVVQTAMNRKAQAEANAHDDLVMALAIAYQLMIDVKEEVREPTYIPSFELLGGAGRTEGQYV